jgi:hypothetical protein
MHHLPTPVAILTEHVTSVRRFASAICQPQAPAHAGEGLAGESCNVDVWPLAGARIPLKNVTVNLLSRDAVVLDDEAPGERVLLAAVDNTVLVRPDSQQL